MSLPQTQADALSSPVPLPGPAPEIAQAQPRPSRASLGRRLCANTLVRIGGGVLLAILLLGVFCPWLGTVDPNTGDFMNINVPPGTRGEFTLFSGETVAHTYWMGSDSVGRDIYSRLLYGTRVSLAIGALVGFVAVAVGTLAGVLAGYFRRLDGAIMRLMDAVMAIPSILLAVALVAFWRGGMATVIFAIAITEIPRVARLVRSVVLTVREEPYVEAAIALGTPVPKILWRHVMPNAIAPLIVQGTFICAAAILIEATLSFLGVGLPADIPTWGSVMAGGRVQFTERPDVVLYPGLFLALTVLSINLLGDGLRDTLDPKFNKRGAQ
jgi:peptide/nickel transport system permease protein